YKHSPIKSELMKINTKTSYMDQLRGQYSYNRKQVLYLTGMDDKDLLRFQESLLIDWLQVHTLEERETLEPLFDNTLIWKWWINEWNRRDESIVLPNLYHFNTEEQLMRYRQFHQVVFSINSVPYDLLDKSYAETIGKIIDNTNERT